MNGGDRVAAAVRDVIAIQPLADKYGDAVLPMTLDITDSKADRVAVERAFHHFGRVDVIVNNDGYGLFGAVKEVAEEDVRRQIDTGLSVRCGSLRLLCRICVPRAADTLFSSQASPG